MADACKLIDSKKYMWDGSAYEKEEDAQEKKSEYEGAGFETELIEDDGRYLIYTRRVVTEIGEIEGAPITVDISRGLA